MYDLLDPWDIADRFMMARHDRGLSQATLAKMIGVDRKTIAKIDNGQARSVSFGTVAAALDAVGLKFTCGPMIVDSPQTGSFPDAHKFGMFDDYY